MHISEQEAYTAMYKFLDEAYQRTRSGTLGALLGSMSLLPDGQPVDPAVWSDWLRCLEQAQQGHVDATLRLG